MERPVCRTEEDESCEEVLKEKCETLSEEVCQIINDEDCSDREEEVKPHEGRHFFSAASKKSKGEFPHIIYRFLKSKRLWYPSLTTAEWAMDFKLLPGNQTSETFANPF